MIESEAWKPVVGFEKIYSVSNLGRIRRDASSRGKQAGHMLKPQPFKYSRRRASLKGHKTGRYYVDLSNAPIRARMTIHKVVATAFLGPCPKGLEMNHKDGNPSNNRLDNLEYLTRSENHRHAFAIGTKCYKGERNPTAKLTNDDVRRIRQLLEEGNFTQRKIARAFSIAESHVSEIKHRATWSHLN